MKVVPETHLLDVNVLFALLWPRHVHHAVAMEWFAATGHRSWASNAITELGVLRLLTNPTVARHTVSAATAMRAVREATSHPNHVFWGLDRPIPQMLADFAPRLTGHRQWTDAALLRHAAERKGRLATFDKGYADIADTAERAHLTILAG